MNKKFQNSYKIFSLSLFVAFLLLHIDVWAQDDRFRPTIQELLNQYEISRKTSDRIILLINMCDISDDQVFKGEKGKILYNLATKENDTYAIMYGAQNVILSKLNTFQLDSVSFYVDKMLRPLAKQYYDFEGLPEYYDMMYRTYSILYAKNAAEQDSLIDTNLVFFDKHKTFENKYQRVERRYIYSIIKSSWASKLNSLQSAETKSGMMEQAEEEMLTFPLYARFKFSTNIYSYLLTFIKNRKSKIEVSKRWLNIIKDYYTNEVINVRNPYVSGRKYYFQIYLSFLNEYVYFPVDTLDYYHEMVEKYYAEDSLLRFTFRDSYYVQNSAYYTFKTEDILNRYYIDYLLNDFNKNIDSSNHKFYSYIMNKVIYIKNNEYIMCDTLFNDFFQRKINLLYKSYFANISSHNNQIDTSFINKAYSFNKKLIDLIHLGKTRGLIDTLSIIQQRSNIYKYLGNYKDAYGDLANYSQNRKYTFRNISNSKIKDLEIKSKMDDIELQSLEISSLSKRKTTYLISIILFLAILITITIYILYKKEQRLKITLLEQRSKATAAEGKKQAFLHNIAHEIRTPINSIHGYSELFLTNSLSEEDKPIIKKALMKTTNELTSMIDDMLFVAYFDNFNDNDKIEECDLKEVSNEVLDQLIFKTSDYLKKINFSVDISNDARYLKTNKLFLSKIIEELLKNAFLYTEKGVIKIQTKKREDNIIRLLISDTGIGIKEEDQKQIFDKFVKLNEFTQGAGLGLYICKLIAQHLNGDVYLVSSSEQGSTFGFDISMDN